MARKAPLCLGSVLSVSAKSLWYIQTNRVAPSSAWKKEVVTVGVWCVSSSSSSSSNSSSSIVALKMVLVKCRVIMNLAERVMHSSGWYLLRPRRVVATI
jgi:hypothetical protein